MAAGQYDFTIEQGATWAYRLTVQKPDGTVLALTGFSARCQIRKKHTSSEVIANVTCAVTPATGIVDLSLTSVQTTAIAAGEYVYDVELYDTSATPVVRRLLEGAITVTPEVTR